MIKINSKLGGRKGVALERVEGGSKCGQNTLKEILQELMKILKK